MRDPETTERFVRQLTEHQNRLFGYIFSLVGDRASAEDVVQETNLVLWRKIDEYQPEKPFLPWAFAIARFQVLAYLRDRKRDRVLLDATLVESLADEAARQASEFDEIREALRPCLGMLTPSNRDLIEHRYFRATPLADVAESLGRSVGAIKVALLRIRKQLADCVEKRIAAGH